MADKSAYVKPAHNREFDDWKAAAYGERLPKLPDTQSIADATYLRALADEFEAGVLVGAHPQKIAEDLRAIAARIDGSGCAT